MRERRWPKTVYKPTDIVFELTKDELRQGGFEAIWQDDPEGFWAQAPPIIEVAVDPVGLKVRYCFDNQNNSHFDDYYEYGREAVEAALNMLKKLKRNETLRVSRKLSH